MFDDTISTYKTFGSAPVNLSLKRWINACMNKGCKHVQQVKRYRETGEVHIKKRLPHATISAICTDGRSSDDVLKRTGWVALDIDPKDNPRWENAANLRDQVAKISYVAFAALSVSGEGVWALVKVKDPEKQERYFKQLQTDFESRSIVLDSTKGQNPNDARFYSYDPDAYIANDFKIYDRLPKQNQSKTTRPPTVVIHSASQGDDTKSKVEALIGKIQARRIDITIGYENWRNLGFALENEFGENGRDYFHAISEYHSGYDPKETDQNYTNWLNHERTNKGVGIGTFFYKCEEFGISFDQHHETRRDSGLESKYKDDDPAPYGFNAWTGEVFDQRGYPSEWDTVTLD